MKKRYVLAIALASFLRTQGHAQISPENIDFRFGGAIDRSLASPKDVLSTDLDGDGDQDVLAASYDQTVWYANDGAGNFGAKQVVGSSDRIKVVHAADLDGDGDQDVISTSTGNRRITIYANDGQGGFTETQKIFPEGAASETIFTADLDGDGDQDILADASYGGFYNSDNKIIWYANDGQGNFGEQQIIDDGLFTGSVYATDLDGDGDQDALAILFGDNQITWYANDGQGNFGEQQVIFTQASDLDDIYATDLDGDGDQDVLASISVSSGDNSVVWFANDGQGNFSEQQVLSEQTSELIDIYAADLDGDGDQDVLTASYISNEIAFYVNNGRGNFSEPQVISDQVDGAFAIYAADLDGDGNRDVLTIAEDSNDVTWYENQLPGQPTAEPDISSLTLFNARTDTRVQPLTDGDVINLLSPQPNLYDYNVDAQVNAVGQTITRVVFELDAPDAAGQDTVRVERKAPYVLFGHLGKDFREVQAYAGDYTLTATPYYRDSTGAEVTGQSTTVNFTFVTPNMDIRDPRLVDASSGQVIERLDAGDVVSLVPNQAVSVLADIRFSNFNSIEFFLDGPNPDGQADITRLENQVPYTLFGDQGSEENVTGQPLAPGEYELRIIGYLGKNRDGYAGPQTVIPFTVTNDASESEPLAYPVPFSNELNLRTESTDASTMRVQLVDAYGQVYEVLSGEMTATEDGVRIDVSNLPVGPYTVQLQRPDGPQTFRITKE